MQQFVESHGNYAYDDVSDKNMRSVITASTILYIPRSAMITIISPINYPHINTAQLTPTWSPAQRKAGVYCGGEATAHSESPAVRVTGLT